MSWMADAGGPMNIIPSRWHKSENSTLSDRKPYPGWIAWQLANFATFIIFELFKYDCDDWAEPIWYASSASWTCNDFLSASE